MVPVAGEEGTEGSLVTIHSCNAKAGPKGLAFFIAGILRELSMLGLLVVTVICFALLIGAWGPDLPDVETPRD